MPKTKFQQLFFAFLTVLITVHLFVFYNLAIEMGGMCNQVFIDSINIVPIEFLFAFLLDIFIAGPLAFKGFNSELIANWLQNIVINFPFAFFTQLFLIQPFVRFVFRNVFKNQLNNDKCIVNEA